MAFNFLRSFCKLMEQTEVPQRFQVWCGVAALLSVMERRIWITQGIYSIYPNFFIVLVAASGQKKSTPINVVDKLLRQVKGGPNVVAQKVSTEALISSIKRREVSDSTRLLKETCGGIVIADELATFLDRSSLDRGLGPMLTKLYDCSPFEYETIKRGTETVEGGYLSLLGGTTIELLRNSLPKDAIGGGFTSRTIFIYEDRRAPPVPWVTFDESHLTIEGQLVEHLNRLVKYDGPVEVSPRAVEFFKYDYNTRYNDSTLRLNGALQNYENRRHTHLFKVAMAIMLAEEPSLRLDVHHIAAAKTLLEEAETQMPKVMTLLVASEVGTMAQTVYAYIKSHEIILRADIMRHFSHQLDSHDMSKIMSTLTESGRVKTTVLDGKLAYAAL